MKFILTKITLITFMLISFIPDTALAERKIFVKEYTYQASDFDSKMSSRAIALEQVKRLLLEEVGTYLVSETDVRDFHLTRDRITTLTAGIVQSEILLEKWDGKTYYLRARISLDPGDVTKFIGALIENNQKSRELEETKRKVDEALKRIKELQDERTAGLSLESRQKEYSKAIAQLKAQDLIEKGLALMNTENYREGLEAFDRAIDIDPVNVWAHINKGWALTALGNYHQALREFDVALAIDPKNPWIYVNRGVTYNFLENYQQGLLDEEKAISMDATISWAYIDRGWSHIGLGRFNDALADLKKAEQLDPKNPHVYHLRAWAHHGLGNKKQTLEDFETSLRLAPDNSWTHWNIAAYHALGGEKGKALSALEKAVSINKALKQKAKNDKNFQSLWKDAEFRKIVE